MSKSQSRPNWLRRWAMGGLAAIALLSLAACRSDEVPDELVTNEAELDVEEVAEEPGSLLGQRVTLRGDVEQQVDSAAFTLREDTLFPDDAVLVINATGTSYTVPEDEAVDVWVVGEVQEFVLATIEETYELDLDDELYVEYEAEPVVVASYIALAPDAETVAEDPTAFYGERIVVDGEIETVYAPDAFSLEADQLFESGELLVVGAVPEVAQEDNVIAVSGILLPFSIENLEQEYELQWDAALRDLIAAEYTGQPALIAQEIYPFTE
ncbi:MAG: hypothetical protein F6J97_18250 [Leptolyngbya sp. SIO4C1]|nr:hypothetical protein [Leptolyngbya sp. SIO4C1]